MYEMTEQGVRRLSDGAIIPMADGNRDYQDFVAWVEDGNAPANYIAPPLPVPQQVSPYQARMALLAAGRLHDVEVLMADSDTDQAARIAWEYATVWDRRSAFISTLGTVLGLTEAQIDALFTTAAAIV